MVKITGTIMQRAKGKIEIFTHIYKLGLLPCSLAAAAIRTAAALAGLRLACSAATMSYSRTARAGHEGVFDFVYIG